MSGAVGAIPLMGSSGGAIDFLGMQLHFPMVFEAWDIWEIFLLDASTYALALFIIPFITYDSTEDLTHRSGPYHSKTEDRLAIFNRTQRDTRLRFGLIRNLIVLLIEVQYLLSLYVDNHLEAGADVYASSEVYFALGSLSAGFPSGDSPGYEACSDRSNADAACWTFLHFSRGIQEYCNLHLLSAAIGFTNAGTRITRVTHLFNNIPNNIIGRANSRFYVYNIAIRRGLPCSLSTAFFDNGNNAIQGVSSAVRLSSCPLFHWCGERPARGSIGFQPSCCCPTLEVETMLNLKNASGKTSCTEGWEWNSSWS